MIEIVVIRWTFFKTDFVSYLLSFVKRVIH